MFRHLAYFLTCLSTVFVATTLHAQTLAPKPTALPDVGFAIIKTSQVAVVEALLVLGGRFTKQADSNFFLRS